jgi:glutathione S-transferase
MPELIHLSFSPWSEKARWALDLCGVEYRAREYVPVLGELELRRLLRRPRGQVTVPLLRDGERVFCDSYTIACYANDRSTRHKLFPRGQEARVAHYDALSERGMAAARALALPRLLRSGDALADLVPKPLRKLRRLAAMLAGASVRRTQRKYGGHLGAADEYERVLCEVLDTLREDLARSESREQPKTLLSELSYADIAMAQVVSCVRPPGEGVRIGRAMRAAFSDAKLSERYADLVSWRDALYARYRRPQP